MKVILVTLMIALAAVAAQADGLGYNYGVRNDLAGPLTDGAALTMGIAQPLGWWVTIEPQMTISDKVAPSAMLVFAPADFGLRLSPTVGAGYVRGIDGNRWALLAGLRLALPFSATESVWLGYSRALSLDLNIDDADLLGIGVSVGI